MANKQINELSELTSTASGDLIPIYDLDEAGSEKTKKITVGNLFLPQGYIDGFQMSNAADTEHDIQVTTGICRASNITGGIELSSAMTKQIDAPWAAGSDAGGMFTGSVAADTWYHMFVIKKDSDGSIDAGFGTDITASGIPGGYTGYRRIGSVLTDASANIKPFFQTGDKFEWHTRPSVTYTQGTSPTLRTLSVPPGLKVQAIITAYVFKSSGFPSVYFTDPNTDSDSGYSFVRCVTTGVAAHGFVSHIITNTSSQIQTDSNTSSTSLRISSHGWIDPRGKDY